MSCMKEKLSQHAVQWQRLEARRLQSNFEHRGILTFGIALERLYYMGRSLRVDQVTAN